MGPGCSKIGITRHAFLFSMCVGFRGSNIILVIRFLRTEVIGREVVHYISGLILRNFPLIMLVSWLNTKQAG